MRVALVNPPTPYLIVPGQLEPLGLQYLEAAVEHHLPDVDVKLVNLAAGTFDEAIWALQGYDVIAYTATTLDYKLVRRIAEAMSGTNCLQVIGGPHATVSQLQADSIWHAVFYGEGEETFIEYLTAVNEGKLTQLVYAAPPTADLNTYQWPTRKGGEVLSVIGSRGCAQKCAFCSAQTLWPGRVRRRDVNNEVLAEIRILHKLYPEALISLFDEDLGSNHKWLYALCEGLKGTGTRWKAQMRVDRTTVALLTAMREAGCVEIDFGIESFDQGVLDALDKHTTVQRNIEAIEMAYEAGLPSRLYMMIGTPGQRYRETVRANVAVLEGLKDQIAVVCMLPFTPMPGTPIADNPKKYGITILDDDVSKYHRYAYRRDENGKVVRPVWSPIDIDGMTHDELLEDMAAMYAYTESLEQMNRGDRGKL